MLPPPSSSAQQVFSQFAPDVSGGTREIAIMLTDQATGPVAARQRLLRSFANQPGDTTLWGEEFTGQINNKGRVSADGTLTDYKDHGFGFTLGMDGGSPATAGMAAPSLSIPAMSSRTCRATPAPTPNGTCSPAIPTGTASTSSSIPR